MSSASIQYVFFKINQEKEKNTEQSQKKLKKWQAVTQSWISGALSVGSRTPVSQTPSWVTLEVMTGGFATGQFLAGGPIQEHEKLLYGALVAGTTENVEVVRQKLNEYFLSEEGLSILSKLLDTGLYRVQVPEEGALLTVCYLLRQEDGELQEQAGIILKELQPWFSKLRFYPLPSDTRVPEGGMEAFVRPVRDLNHYLSNVKLSARVQKMDSVLSRFIPSYDELVRIIIETIEGEIPQWETESSTGKKCLKGGWPFQKNTPQLKEQFNALKAQMQEFVSLRRMRSKSVGKLFQIANAYFASNTLTGKQVGLVRKAIADVIQKRGNLSSPKQMAVRQNQKNIISKCHSRLQYAKILKERVKDLHTEGGIDNIATVIGPANLNEAQKFSVPVESPIPKTFVQKAKMSKIAPLDQLCEERIIPSADFLGSLIHTVVASVKASGIKEANLSSLYSAVYQAFKRRRSLLLLNFESQVKFSELPWCAALETLRARFGGMDLSQASYQALQAIASIAITTWPQTLLPNKLVGALEDLVKDSQKEIPLVKELASDIFEHGFSEKFLLQAKITASLLEGGPYEKYYGVQFSKVKDITVQKQRTSPAFYEVCKGYANPTGWSVAENGKIIEQAMILTTHNLSALYVGLNLQERLSNQLGKLPLRILQFILQSIKSSEGKVWRYRLQAVKNAAYAWRQMLFFLALLPSPQVEEFFSSGDTLLLKFQELKQKLDPAWENIKALWRNQPVKESKVFLGWVSSKHWIM